jgi:hypothetical protein
MKIIFIYTILLIMQLMTIKNAFCQEQGETIFIISINDKIIEDFSEVDFQYITENQTFKIANLYNNPINSKFCKKKEQTGISQFSLKLERVTYNIQFPNYFLCNGVVFCYLRHIYIKGKKCDYLQKYDVDCYNYESGFHYSMDFKGNIMK